MLCLHFAARAVVPALTLAAPMASGPFRLVSTPLEWYDAKAYCVGQGGHLASVHSAAESEAVSGLCIAAATDCWLGLSDAGHEGSFEWSDGTPLDYEYWNTGEPDLGNGHEDAAYVYVGGGGKEGRPGWVAGRWDDNRPTNAKAFVCRSAGGAAQAGSSCDSGANSSASTALLILGLALGGGAGLLAWRHLDSLSRWRKRSERVQYALMSASLVATFILGCFVGGVLACPNAPRVHAPRREMAHCKGCPQWRGFAL